jgi:DNA-binding HxlR family transcriptional regulator
MTDDISDLRLRQCAHVSDVLALAGSKWSVLIVKTLSSKTLRFNALKREIPNISQRMLTLTLRGLERDGLVQRTVTPSIPPRVDYELTELGQSLLKPVSLLAAWAIESLDAIERARDQFDRRSSQA